MGLFSVLKIALKLFLKIPSIGKLVVVFLLRKFWVPLVLLGSIMPGLLGTYSHLTSKGVEWFLAIPSTIGIEFGGQIPTILNTVQHLNDPTYGGVVLLAGAISAVLNLFWGIYLWKRLNEFLESDLSTFYVLLMGGGFFAMCITVTLAVDLYVLPAEDLRVSGITYFLENPGQTIEPLSQFVSEKAAEDSSLNQSINNSSTG